MEKREGVKEAFSFYYYIHRILFKHFKGIPVSKKKVTRFLYCWKIPKELRPVIIKELENIGLIIKESRYKIRLKKTNNNPTDNIKKLYRRVGVLDF